METKMITLTPEAQRIMNQKADYYRAALNEVERLILQGKSQDAARVCWQAKRGTWKVDPLTAVTPQEMSEREEMGRYDAFGVPNSMRE